MIPIFKAVKNMGSQKVKAISYLLKVMVPLLIFFVILHFFLNQIGERANKKRQEIEVGEISKAAAILDDNKDWKFIELNEYRVDSKPEFLEVKEIGKFSTESLLLFIYENSDKEKANKLIEKLAKFKNLKQIFVASTYDSTLSELRKIEPRFYYGMSVTQMVKFSVFDSLGLEKIFPIKEDFIYHGPYWETKVSASIKKEIQRRNLVLLN